jgi:hypothetical protein
MQNDVVPQSTLKLTLFISATTTSKVSIYQSGVYLQSLLVYPDAMQEVNINSNLMNTESETISNKTIEIISDFPIVVYGINTFYTSSDLFTAIPVSNWGSEYVVVSYQNDIYRGYSDMNPDVAKIPRRSEFLIVAAEDNTNVVIHPKSETAKGAAADKDFSVTLNKGDSYLVQSASVEEGGDLTGTRVASDKPIGVFSGHVRTGMTQTLNYPWASKDHLVEMLQPVSSWGKTFITMPYQLFDQRNSSLFRVCSIFPNTIVKITEQNGIVYSVNLPKDYSFAELDYIQNAAIWESNKPIQIAQYMKHDGGANDNINYDPSMNLIPPVEQYVPRVYFQTPKNVISQQYEGHYILVALEKSALYNVRLDGRLLTEFTNVLTNQVGSSDYYWTSISLNSGSHTLTCDKGALSGILYGFGNADSYSSVLGSSLLSPDLIDNVPPVIKADSLCGNLNGYISEPRGVDKSGLDFAYVNTVYTSNYNYKLGDITDTTTFLPFIANVVDKNSQATFVIEYRDRSGNAGMFQYNYYPQNFVYSKESYDFGVVNLNEKTCADLSVTNKSKISQNINSIQSDNPKITVEIDRALPITLAPDETLNYKICLLSKEDYSDISGKIDFQFDCSNAKSIPVKSKVNALAVTVSGKDFGKVYVGRNVCDVIKIKNNGNKTVKITQLNVPLPSSGFTYDLKDKFPTDLVGGAELDIPVCFNPKGLWKYLDEFQIMNDQGIELKAELKGEGIDPKLEDLTYDWGKTRVGFEKTQTLSINNSGNVEAKVKFYQVETSSPSFDISEFESMNTTLKSGGSLDFKVKYKPLDPNPHYLIAYYIVDDNPDKKYKLELKGEGVIPIMDVKDHEISKRFIFSTTDTLFTVIANKGNETLEIQDLECESSDLASFTFDLSKFKDLKIEPNTSVDLPVVFIPQRVGDFVLNFKASSLCGENYNLETKQFSIKAKAKPIDSLDINYNYYAQGDERLCNSFTFTPYIENNGNVSVTLSDLYFESSDTYSIDWVSAPSLPITVNPGDHKEFPIKFIPKSSEPAQIKAFFTLNDNVQEIVSYQYQAKRRTLVLQQLPDFKYSNNEAITIPISGKFPDKSDIPVGMEIYIGISNEAMKLIDSNYNMILKKNNSEIKIPLVLEQKNNYIKVSINRELIIENSSVVWQLDLRFRTYFSETKQNPITIEFISPDCFYPIADTLISEQNPICVSDLRAIEFIQKPIINLYYNSTDDAVNIELEAFQDDCVSIDIYDYMGKKVAEMKKEAISKGKHLMSMPAHELASGAYFVKFESIYKNDNIVFIKK